MIDGLVEQDNYGNIIPALAESWEHNEDYTVWTFHLREGVQWLTSSREVYGEVTADDFVYVAEFVLDPAETSNNIQSYTTMIEGAQEYDDAMSEWRDNGSVGDKPSFEGVGVKALDEHTVQYTMSKSVPYFTSVALYGLIIRRIVLLWNLCLLRMMEQAALETIKTISYIVEPSF